MVAQGLNNDKESKKACVANQTSFARLVAFWGGGTHQKKGMFDLHILQPINLPSLSINLFDATVCVCVLTVRTPMQKINVSRRAH